MIRATRLAAATPPPIVRDPGIVEAYLEDASGAPPGHAAGLVRPESEVEAAAFLRLAAEHGWAVLPQAARSSLTGGAIPRGEIVVSLERMVDRGPLESCASGAWQTIGAGVRLADLQSALAPAGWYYPPVPTYQQAMVGGSVSTNAGGAATFKYGVTRDWVRGLRVLLANGDLLVIERGEQVVERGRPFRILLADGSELRVPSPTHRLPPLKKLSAGYHSAERLDLVDLFIGAEGTLGLITAATLRFVPRPPAVLTGIVGTAGTSHSLGLTRVLRDAARRGGPDVRAIEWLDAGALRILRRSGEISRLRVPLAERTREALLFEMEIDRRTGDAEVREILAAFLEGRAGAGHPLFDLFALLDRERALDTLELAFPEDAARQRAFADLREAVPLRVAETLAARGRERGGVEKVGGDLIVPFEQLPEMVGIYAEGFRRRGLDHAIWGHVGDGNLHPNAIPRDADEVRRGFDALVEFADEAVRRGGSPLSEHGVGRHPLKQALLGRFLGAQALERMREIKRTLDPAGRLAPGVLFPPAVPERD